VPAPTTTGIGGRRGVALIDPDGRDSMGAMATTEIRRTACSLDCFDACGIVAEVTDGRIVRIGGDPDHPITRGALCNKVNHYLRDRFYHADRQLHPLRKVSGGWQRLAWDDALDLIAEKLSLTKDRHGPLSVLYHKGNGSFAGLKIMGERFFNLYGGVTQAVGRFCGGEADYGTTQSFGACEIHDPLDLAEHTRLFLIWGRNPAVTNIHMMPVLKEARARGARAIVIDPALTKTVRYCDGHVQPRPGSDGHLAIGMAKVILAKRDVDRARVAAISERFDDYLAIVNGLSLDEIGRRTDLAADTIETLALDYADTKPATILQGIGLQQYTRGAQTYRLIAALGILTGNVGIPGGGVNFGNWPWAIMHKPVALERRTAPVRTVPVTKLAEALASTTGPRLRLAFFMGTNLVNQMPDTLGTQRELAKLDFRVCVDQFLTDTAECADVFLPSTTMLEEEDFLPSYGHLWMQLMQPVVSPQGESRSDLTILQQLAERLGFGAEMAGSPAYWIDQLTSTFRPQGVSHASLQRAGGRLWPAGTPRVPWADGRFKTASGRFVFPATLDDDPVLPPAEFPLHLIALASERAINSQIPEERQHGACLPARVHSSVAMSHGLRDGEVARLVSARGVLRVRLACDDGLRTDSVFVPKGEWAKHARGLNVLTEPRVTAGTGTAYNQNFVRLERA
jgi:anaerobic selenocysteine-containing dehydrogenase